jgi:hypothetical protein
VKSVGALQTMLAWAEDRALLRSTPSADPGAKTGARAEHASALRSLADHNTTAPGLAPMRQTFAARCRDNQATMPFTIQLRQSDEIPFHGEPRHRQRLVDLVVLRPAPAHDPRDLLSVPVDHARQDQCQTATRIHLTL